MKPKDLKPPFSFKERHPLLQDSVFYVPEYYPDYQGFSLPDLPTLFGNTHPVFIEFCAGNGDWVVNRAISDPHQNWIAVEMRFDRVRKIWAKMKNHSLDNLFIVCAEAFTFTRHYLLDRVLDGAFINFPDPWPKLRHAKHRLMKPPFLTELSRILKPQKQVTFVTDDQTYLEETVSHFNQHPQFSPFLPAPFYTHEFPRYGSSWFEKLWKEKGKQIYFTQFRNAITG